MSKIIAIDGPSGSGKSTIAKLIASEIGFDYLDTGALYRAVALGLREEGIEPDAPDDKIIKALKGITVTFKGGRVFLKNASRLTPHGSRSYGKDISEDIRSKEIDHYSSVFSARKVVRDFLLETQRKAASSKNVVVEGRDTTTVLFPNAWKKIYLDASLEERAKRRYLQFIDKYKYASLEEARRDVIERDERDSSRDISPLKKADCAFLLDSSNLSIEQVKEKILRFIKAEP
jgi:cytidylate kinase